MTVDLRFLNQSENLTECTLIGFKGYETSLFTLHFVTGSLLLLAIIFTAIMAIKQHGRSRNEIPFKAWHVLKFNCVAY